MKEKEVVSLRKNSLLHIKKMDLGWRLETSPWIVLW